MAMGRLDGSGNRTAVVAGGSMVVKWRLDVVGLATAMEESWPTLGFSTVDGWRQIWMMEAAAMVVDWPAIDGGWI
ncbi:hypothetical protein Dimus_033592, partial [Dionaea muscipula]